MVLCANGCAGRQHDHYSSRLWLRGSGYHRLRTATTKKERIMISAAVCFCRTMHFANRRLDQPFCRVFANPAGLDAADVVCDHVYRFVYF